MKDMKDSKDIRRYSEDNPFDTPAHREEDKRRKRQRAEKEKQDKKKQRKLRKPGRMLKKSVIRDIKRYEGHIPREKRKDIRKMSVEDVVREANTLNQRSERTKKLLEKVSKIYEENGERLRVERVEGRHRIM